MHTHTLTHTAPFMPDEVKKQMIHLGFSKLAMINNANIIFIQIVSAVFTCTLYEGIASFSAIFLPSHTHTHTHKHTHKQHHLCQMR